MAALWITLSTWLVVSAQDWETHGTGQASLSLHGSLDAGSSVGDLVDSAATTAWEAGQDGVDTAESAASDVLGAVHGATALTAPTAPSAGPAEWQELQSSSLKIAVLADGGLGQPFYRNRLQQWTKLTYGSKHMDYAIKVDGELAKLTGDLDVVTTSGSSFAGKSQLTLNGVPQATVLRSYSFLGDGMVFNITFTFTALTDVSDLQVYLGTSDDWIGSSDQPSKEQGSFHQGQFRAEAHGKVLRVQSSDEAVFVFSPNPESHAIILQHYGNFADVYAATMSDMSESTSDGAYGIYVPCGHLASGETKKATIFYAAAGADELQHLLRVTAEAESKGNAEILMPSHPIEETPGASESDVGASDSEMSATDETTEATHGAAPKVFLQSSDLKIGVMEDGSLDQPFYYSQKNQQWTKLTYGTKKLDYAIKVNGHLASLGSEATVESDSKESVAVRSQLIVDGVSQGGVLRSYDFVGDGMILKITYSFSALTHLSDVKLWLGTSDDWIGDSDRPNKETGYFQHGFVQSQGGHILRVESGDEAVFVFSPNPGAKAIILQHYGNWPRVYESDQSEVSRSSSDGAYAIYVPLGPLEVGQTKEATIFYAASGANQLTRLARISEEADEVAESEATTTALATLPTTAQPTATWATAATTVSPATTTVQGLAVLQSHFLKIAVLEDGSLGQPFYYSANMGHMNLGTGELDNSGGWTKLTYGSKKLDYAIKVDGNEGHVSGAAIESSGGQKSLATRSQITVNGKPKAEVLRSYSFTGDGMVLNVTYSFTALSPIYNLQVWLGTSDDWIGSSDRPTKEQGIFVGGDFVPTSHGKILRVQSGEEAVFVFSPQSESHAIILQHYGNWPAVSAAEKSDLARSTSDGAYAIYVPLGQVAAGETKTATVYYAAAAASQLSHLLRVTEQVAKTEAPTTTTTTTTTTATVWTFATVATTMPTTTTEAGLAVLQTAFLKIAVLEDGSLGQPFYASDQRGWTKLTYASKHLDYTIKAEGKLAAIAGAPMVEKSGSSSLSTRSQMTVDGFTKAELVRSYNFLGNGMVLNITYTFTALADMDDLEVWLGTSDDWIGDSDRPTKQQGSFGGGSFLPAPHGQILQVESGEESVFIFSPNPESHAIILEHYGNWPAVSASRSSDLAESRSDGAYAIYVPLGSLRTGETKSATIFYAAAGANRLQDLLRVAGSVDQRSTTSTSTWLATLPSTTTTDLAYVLQSLYLRIGVLGDGGLGQPFYKSQLTGWTKLTFSQLHLSTTVKINGEIADLGRAASIHFHDAQHCTITEELSVQGETQALLKRIYSFTGNGLVFQANFSFQALKALDSVEVWVGTSDDWIGTTDRPLKQQGKFAGNQFEPTEHGHILRVHSGDENVFVFSTHPGSHAIIRAQYGRWSLIHAARHSELASSLSDGAYGIYVPLGSFAPQAQHSASFFYAAAEASQLSELLDSASAVDGGGVTHTTTTALPANMLETSFLRLKLLDEGGLGQPFYYSPYGGWTQLTYAKKPLECTVKVDGEVVDIASDPSHVKWWDYENAMATTELTPGGELSAVLTRTYGFKQEGMIFFANFTFTAQKDIDNLEVWLGTSDDFIGVTDQPTKVQGDFTYRGIFEPKRHGDVLHVYSGQESVLMFGQGSEQDEAAIILRHYGRWHEMQVTKSDLYRSQSDGAYGIYVSLGQLRAGQSKTAMFYYGAAPADQLTPLSRAASALRGQKKSFRSKELLVWDVDRCNMQKANSSVDCELAHTCYDVLWRARSACRVVFVSTMTIAEMKSYICGNFTCSYKSRSAREDCAMMYPNDMGWLDPIHHYRNRYCGVDGHATDLINDHDTCTKSQEPLETPFCKTVRHCYAGFAQVATSCKVDLPTMAETRNELCGLTCKDAITKVVSECGHYTVVRDAADSMIAYQRYFGCDEGSAGIVLKESKATLQGDNGTVDTLDTLDLQEKASAAGGFWKTKESTYLTAAYQYCMSSSSSELGSPVCQRTTKCFEDLRKAEESCSVIWLPTMTVSEVSKYVCSGSICHGLTLDLGGECRHYHRVASLLRPVEYYQEKYCPSWEQDVDHLRDPDLVNDLYLCTIRKSKRTTPLCNTVINCNEQITAVDRECSGNAGTTEEAMDLVCSNPCRTFIENAAMYCANYSYLMTNLQAYRVYMDAFDCAGRGEDDGVVAACIRGFKLRMRRILSSAGSSTGAFLLTSLVGISLAFFMLRSISLRWHCSPPRMGYECLADNEIPWSHWEETTQTSRLDEELLLLA